MSNVYEIPADKYNLKLAEALKKLEEFKMPEWAVYVKTSVSKIRPPEDTEGWWYRRVASILRQIYLNKVVGVQRLRVKYGSKKNRGSKPEAFKKASGKIIRVMLQQSEKAGFLEKVTQGRRFGRKLTKKGTEFLEGIK
ncbi:30S ribosomal protein S19e [Candidatus Pacearchaeota archaeon]|nr:30S ribosomal protein S19e [Candidatus Pacearchaeota archaeon]